MIRPLMILLIVATAMLAEEVYESREFYNSVTEMIAGDELYVTEMEINSLGSMYPAVGTYSRSFRFYWDLNPDRYPESQLLFITISSQYAAVTEYEEYLFNRQGELVFYFRSGGYDMNEERFYFDDEYLLRYAYNDQQTDRPDDGSVVNGNRILFEADKLFQAFMLTH